MSNNTPKKSDVQTLAEELDGSRRQQAEAIAKFVGGRISSLRDELDEVKALQQSNIDAAKVDGSPEAAKIVNPASRAANAADKAVKEAEADSTPEKVEKAEEKVAEAKSEAVKAKSDLAARMSAAEAKLDNHEERICALEEGQTGLKASVDGLWVSVRAHAQAIATGGGAVTGLRRAGRLAIATFVAVIAVWLLITLVRWDGLGSWDIGVSLAGILAGLTFVWRVATMDDDAPAEAQAEARADAGLDIVREDAH